MADDREKRWSQKDRPEKKEKKTCFPVFVLIFMFLFNLIDEKKLKSVISRSPGYIQYLVMTLLGTFSHGPIYAWYPLMKNFHDKGISYGPISSFLYARGIKLAMMPALMTYFGIKYALVLTVYMLIFANIQGLLIDLLLREKKPSLS
ncbi:MAG: hypothetical protein B6241_11360 [Spirochaetaceae bacterium 4572_59]|nr:MAG: hypothetical protein B6241_11360 [Spirochaetaceae bacterium 4572_59]